MRSRFPVAAGLGVLALVAGCVAVSWPGESKLVPRHGGHPVGSSLWSWLFLGFTCAAFVLYLGSLWALNRGGRLRLVVTLALAIQLAPLAAPLLISTDAWTYWDYGRIAAVHGGNPYVNNPDNGEEYFDKGSLAIVNGSKQFVVNATGASSTVKTRSS